MRKPMFLAAVLAAAIGTAVVAPSTAVATTLIEMTTTDLIQRADLVVRATVVDVWAEEDAHGHLTTRAVLEIEKTIKGDASISEVVVEVPGGRAGDRVTDVSLMPRFSMDEEVLVFLNIRKSGRVGVVGAFQGKYTIRRDPQTRREVLSRTSLSYLQEFDARFLPTPKAGEQPLFLDDMVTQLNTSLAGTSQPGTQVRP